jgi:hypothetical protein
MKGLPVLGFCLLLVGCGFGTCLKDRVEYRQVLIAPPKVEATYNKCNDPPDVTEPFVDQY